MFRMVNFAVLNQIQDHVSMRPAGTELRLELVGYGSNFREHLVLQREDEFARWKYAGQIRVSFEDHQRDLAFLGAAPGKTFTTATESSVRRWMSGELKGWGVRDLRLTAFAQTTTEIVCQAHLQFETPLFLLCSRGAGQLELHAGPLRLELSQAQREALCEMNLSGEEGRTNRAEWLSTVLGQNGASAEMERVINSGGSTPEWNWERLQKAVSAIPTPYDVTRSRYTWAD